MWTVEQRKNITLAKYEAGKIMDTMVFTGMTQETQIEFLWQHYKWRCWISNHGGDAEYGKETTKKKIYRINWEEVNTDMTGTFTGEPKIKKAITYDVPFNKHQWMMMMIVK